MTEKIRVYELARKCNCDNREVVTAAERLCIPVKSNSSSMSSAEAERIRRYLQEKNKSSNNIPETNGQTKSQIVTASSNLHKGITVNSPSIKKQPGTNPQFTPSLASVPSGFVATGSIEEDFKYALENSESSFQTFFNDLTIVECNKLNDDVVSLPCFDEDMYARLAKEMQRYTLTEIADQKDDLAQKYARLGTFVGAFLGIFTTNPAMPFLGRNLGRIEAVRGKQISEFMPDPHLFFYQDQHSFLSWSRAQVIAPRFRRIMFSRTIKEDGSIYFRLMPLLVAQSQHVLPMQVFRIDSKSYFYRPIAAGIDRQQINYDPIKHLRRYSHLYNSRFSSPTDIKLTVSGRDIETYQKNLYRYQDDSLDYYYADFVIPPSYVF